MKKISLIITVLNEAKTITPLLKSIGKMFKNPNEVIIVDGGSSDSTVDNINKFAKKNKKLNINVFTKKGNRSIGRNFAVSKAKYNLIAITDAGCTVERKWLGSLVKKHNNTKAKVVAGYYNADAETGFQKAVVPYVLVMPDQVNPDDFLPATRSMLITKSLFKKMGGFNESLRDNEDYEFAKRIEKAGAKIVFAQDAVVSWIPVSTLSKFSKMIYRFARGDVYAGILRPKVILIFARYLVMFLLFLFSLISGFIWTYLGFLYFILGIYILWSISKNYRYVQSDWYWLPILQFTSDIAVMSGSIEGLIESRNK